MSRYRMTSTTQPGGETRCGPTTSTPGMPTTPPTSSTPERRRQHKRLGCIDKVLKTYTQNAIPQVKNLRYDRTRPLMDTPFYNGQCNERGPTTPTTGTAITPQYYELHPLRDLDNTKGVDVLENLMDIKKHNV